MQKTTENFISQLRNIFPSKLKHWLATLLLLPILFPPVFYLIMLFFVDDSRLPFSKFILGADIVNILFILVSVVYLLIATGIGIFVFIFRGKKGDHSFRKYFILVVILFDIVISFAWIGAYKASYAYSSYLYSRVENSLLTVTPETITTIKTSSSPLTLSFTFKPVFGLNFSKAELVPKDATSSSEIFDLPPSVKDHNLTLIKQNDNTYTATLVLTQTDTNSILSKPETISWNLYLDGKKQELEPVVTYNGVNGKTEYFHIDKLARFAVTDVPVTLPPDPGEAGKATLAGVDSDNDGIRDDVEREIVFSYPMSEKVRYAYNKIFFLQQKIMTMNTSHEEYGRLSALSRGYGYCADKTIIEAQPNGSTKNNHYQYIKYVLINSPKREKIYEINSGKGANSGMQLNLPENDLCYKYLKNFPN